MIANYALAISGSQIKDSNTNVPCKIMHRVRTGFLCGYTNTKKNIMALQLLRMQCVMLVSMKPLHNS